MIDGISLIRCKRTDPRYKEIRDRHYIPNHGAIGQQLHYLIMMNDECIGIISGGAAVYAVKPRDEYFGITKENRHVALNGIINNTVFRLEKNIPNLGTQILSLWRKTVAKDWEERYNVKVAGFETFIIENSRRKGAMYKADNWTYVGKTKGSAKAHSHGIENKSERVETEQKLIFCKWIKNGKLPTEYHSTWNKRKVKNNERSEEIR